MSIETPLAERIRPKNLDEFIGQEHIIGAKTILRKQIESKILSSIIIWGPPGIGKTTLAQIIARETERPFYKLSAINSGVKDIREIISKTKDQSGLFDQSAPILFIDEIHRFNKSQQDSLLEAVEKGWVTLIGATTENPSFEVNNALLSRCQVYTLKALEKKHLKQILQRAIRDDIFLKDKNIELKETDALIHYSGGDARRLLNIFEQVVAHTKEKKIIINDELIKNSVKNSPILFDKKGEFYYDIISAFIKSIRGSDPNAAIYWLARLIEGGSDPVFIARRLIILASEDIGLANPNALLIANAAFDAVSKIGWPEARITLAETVIYLANSPKSNTAYTAINAAQKLVKETGNLDVPMQIRNASTKLMKQQGYGKDYKYAHDYKNNFVEMDFLPEELKHHTFYRPQQNSKELKYLEILKKRWKNRYDY